jgi:uncharacterized protein YdiU (UPF0061 family)
MARFAEALLPLFDPDAEKGVAAATEVLNEFPDRFNGYWLAGTRKKLGLRSEESGDAELVQTLLDWMEKSRADFTNTFRDLSADELAADGRYGDAAFREWHARWRERLARDNRPEAEARAEMRAANPAYIARNHRVEEALAAAEERDDLAPLHELLAALASPYEERPGLEKFCEPPADERGYRTFCGT